MQQLLIVIHVLCAISMVALILMQYGKGADVGAAFGSGSSNTMFGSAGALPFLMKVTSGLALLFFVTSLSLGYLASQEVRGDNKLLQMPTTTTQQPLTSPQPTKKK